MRSGLSRTAQNDPTVGPRGFCASSSHTLTGKSTSQLGDGPRSARQRKSSSSPGPAGGAMWTKCSESSHSKWSRITSWCTLSSRSPRSCRPRSSRTCRTSTTRCGGRARLPLAGASALLQPRATLCGRSRRALSMRISLRRPKRWRSAWWRTFATPSTPTSRTWSGCPAPPKWSLSRSSSASLPRWRTPTACRSAPSPCDPTTTCTTTSAHGCGTTKRRWAGWTPPSCASCGRALPWLSTPTTTTASTAYSSPSAFCSILSSTSRSPLRTTMAPLGLSWATS
mmetsp:Transcript_25721/g.60734  ORF Transcript_25721/g.60734 Transcript_25721/m.60734 type:complete len:282 (+) Transcript_25721:870-1715(+)